MEYGQEIRELLKQLATDESSVDESDTVEYLESHTSELAEEYRMTYRLWQERFTSSDSTPTHTDEKND